VVKIIKQVVYVINAYIVEPIFLFILNFLFIAFENGKFSSFIHPFIKSLLYMAKPLIIPITAEAINNSIIKIVIPQPLFVITPSKPTIVPLVLDNNKPTDTITYIKETILTPKASAIGPFLGDLSSPNEPVGV
jgi:hypothetical protein